MCWQILFACFGVCGKSQSRLLRVKVRLWSVRLWFPKAVRLRLDVQKTVNHDLYKVTHRLQEDGKQSNADLREVTGCIEDNGAGFGRY